MKKLFWVFAAFVAVSFTACGNKTAQGEAVDTDTVALDSVVDTLVVDSAAADTICFE